MPLSTAIPILSAGVRLGEDRFSQSPILLYPEGFMQLNDTAAAIVKYCDGLSNVEQITQKLSDEYEADPTTIRDEIESCLLELKRLRMIKLSSE